MLTILLTYLFCGIAIGLISGLFGIGGGIVGIPVLIQCFAKQGMPITSSVHMAIGTMLAVAPATTFAAIYKHNKNQLLVVSLFKKIAPYLTAGSLAGTIVSGYLNALFLQRIFAVFLLIAALRMILGQKDESSLTDHSQPALVDGFFLPLAATGIGVVSGMLGLGGGILLVPYLTWRGLPLKNAIATATACIVPAAIVGTISFLSMHASADQSVSFSTGYIYWPAFAGISMMSIFFAPLGAGLTQKIGSPVLKTCFSLLLVAVAFHLAR